MVQQTHRLVISSKLNQQATEVVSGRIIVRLELQRSPQQTLSFRMVTALNGKETKISVGTGVARVKLHGLFEFILGRVELSLGARRITYEVMHCAVFGKKLSGPCERYARFRITTRAKISHAQADVINRLRCILLDCLFIKGNRPFIALMLD